MRPLLSVKDPCNALTSRPSMQPPQGGRACHCPHPSPTQQREPASSGMGLTPALWRPRCSSPTGKAQDIRAADSDEQKQTAAVALCQLAAYSPGNVELRGPRTHLPARCTHSPGLPESQEAQCDLRPKGQKRTSPREAGRASRDPKRQSPGHSQSVHTEENSGVLEPLLAARSCGYKHDLKCRQDSSKPHPGPHFLAWSILTTQLLLHKIGKKKKF